MKIAALYDVHGNLPALEAVLDDLRAAEVDRVVIGGDVVPGPMPSESLALLLDLDLPVEFVRGNGERIVLAQRAGEPIDEIPEPHRNGIRWNAAQLGSEQAATIATWPLTTSLRVGGLGEVFFCHATPRDDNELFTRTTDQARLEPVFGELEADLVVCGHTHMPFDRTICGVRVVNAGSVGMPFGEPGADWLLLGEGIEPQRTTYDLEAAAARVRATGCPGADELARGVLEPPSAKADGGALRAGGARSPPEPVKLTGRSARSAGSPGAATPRSPPA